MWTCRRQNIVGKIIFFFKMFKSSTFTFKMGTNDLNHHQSPILTLWHFDLALRIMVYMVDVINIL